LELPYKVFLLIIWSLYTLPGHASFLIEPSYHYQVSDFSRGDESGDLEGKVLGINLGYLGRNFMAGVHIEKGEFESDNNLTDSGYKKYNGGGVGTFLGFHFFDRLKIWSEYMNSSLEPISNNDIRYFGQHVAFGLGYRIINGLLLNYKSFRNQFTQIEDDSTGKTSGLSTNIKTQGSSVFLSYMLVF
jgi:hypothetical protein